VWPGSPAWVHAGSPRSAITGDSIALLCGTDGNLHPLGYEIEDTGGVWVANTLTNREKMEDHKETIRLTAAVKQIMRDMPDRKIHRPVDTQNVSITIPDTGYDRYNEIMQWADSIATVYDDPDFYQEEENYYRAPERLDDSMYDPRVES
jgi:hypothetical protein